MLSVANEEVRDAENRRALGTRAVRLSADFASFDGHRSLVLRWRPDGVVKAQILVLPAFGDEMNQMRRMVRLAAEALGDRGAECWIFDLYGTGDSSAGFEDATLDRWMADGAAMVDRMLQVRSISEAPLLLLGCRLGAALAVRLSHVLAIRPAGLIAWAPVLHGRSQLSGALRAASIARGRDKPTATMVGPEPGTDDPKTLWAAGRPAFLGGYSIGAALAAALQELDATDPPAVDGARLLDVRLSTGDEAPVAAQALRNRAEIWTASGVPTRAEAVAGAGFWNVADLIDIPALIDATVAAAVQLVPGLATADAGKRADDAS